MMIYSKVDPDKKDKANKTKKVRKTESDTVEKLKKRNAKNESYNNSIGEKEFSTGSNDTRNNKGIKEAYEVMKNYMQENMNA